MSVTRSTWDGAVTVHKYGVPASYDLPDEAMDQLRAAHRLRNQLVEIEHDYATAVQATWAEHPEISDALTAEQAAKQAVDDLVERAKNERKTDRTTVARAATKAELADARRRLREAKAVRKDAKTRHYTDLKAALGAVNDTRKQNIKDTYKAFCQDGIEIGGGDRKRLVKLYWATYNHVVDTHRTAVKLVTATRTQGRASELRFKRWEGTGTLTAQLQRQAGMPERDWEMLCSDEGKWRNVVRFTPITEPAGPFPPSVTRPRWMVRVTIGGGLGVDIPIIMHRPLPPDADVTQVQVTRRTIAGKPRISVAVSCRIPAPETATGTLAAVHFGWRSLAPDAGDIRVATIASQSPLSRPRSEIPVRWVGGAWEVYLPGGIRNRFDHPDALRSQRDKSLDVLRGDLVDWLDRVGPIPHPLPGPDGDHRELTPAVIDRWRSPGRFAQLAVAWRDNPPDVEGGTATAGRLEAWRKQDKHLWTWEANERDQLTARVKDMWLKVAAWLAGQCGMIVLDATEIAKLAAVPDVGEEDTPQGRAARRQRQIGSPGELRALMRRAAAARGVAVEDGHARTGGEHVACGGQLSGDPATSLRLWCQSCGAAVDQDVNSVAGMLAAASAPVPDDDTGTARTGSD